MAVNVTTLELQCPRCGNHTLTDVTALISVPDEPLLQPVPVRQTCSRCGFTREGR